MGDAQPGKHEVASASGEKEATARLAADTAQRCLIEIMNLTPDQHRPDGRVGSPGTVTLDVPPIWGSSTVSTKMQAGVDEATVKAVNALVATIRDIDRSLDLDSIGQVDYQNGEKEKPQPKIDNITLVLLGKTDAERAVFNHIYQCTHHDQCTHHGISLEDQVKTLVNGPEFVRFVNALHRKDNDQPSQNAGRLYEDLYELQNGNGAYGRNNDEIKADIRRILSITSPEDIQTIASNYKLLAAEFKSKYGYEPPAGDSLFDAVEESNAVVER